jgi:hypothetical protein
MLLLHAIAFINMGLYFMIRKDLEIVGLILISVGAFELGWLAGGFGRK